MANAHGAQMLSNKKSILDKRDLEHPFLLSSSQTCHEIGTERRCYDTVLISKMLDKNPEI